MTLFFSRFLPEFFLFSDLASNFRFLLGKKFPNCAVLALDSWNYCSGEQARQPNICKIVQSSLYS